MIPNFEFFAVAGSQSLVGLFGQPLLADFGDIIGLIVWVIIIVISVVSKISKATNGGKNLKPRPAQPGPPPGQGPLARNVPQEGARPQAPGRPKTIESEIEEFLRKARGDGPGVDRQKPNVDPRQPPRQPQPANKPPQLVRPKPQVVEAIPVEKPRAPGGDFGRGLSDHVEQHIGRDSISERDSKLGDYLEQADERTEAHLHETFDHDVGLIAQANPLDTLIADGTDAVDQRDVDREAVAERVRKMLSNPDSVRDVIIAAEILKRPDF